MIRVAIVENETLVREGFRRVLELDGGLSVEDEVPQAEIFWQVGEEKFDRDGIR